MEKTTEDSAMRRAHLMVALVGAVLGFGGLSFFGLRPGLSALAGASIASVNLFVLSRTVQKMVQGAGASWAGVALTKFFVLMLVTYGLIQSGIVEPFGLAVGFGALPLGILLAGILPAETMPAQAMPAQAMPAQTMRAPSLPSETFDPHVKSDHA